MTTEDRFFEEVFRGELEMGHREHPGFSVLWDYAASRLEQKFAEKISLHVASCGQCARELREIREERQSLLEGLSRLRPDPLKRFPFARPFAERARERLQGWGEQLLARRVFYRHALAYVSVGALVLLVNVWMNLQPGLLGLGRQSWWALWLLVPWGVLLLLHALRAFWSRQKP